MGPVEKFEAALDAAKEAWESDRRETTRKVQELLARAEKAEAALANVTAERDEARRMTEIRLRAIESIRHASLRATPAEGD